MTSRTEESDTNELLAFCHIEKAAGTSLIHVLRRIFFLRYAAVRPMHSRKSIYFTARDLRTILRLNPFLKGIGGHSVVPHTDLISATRRVEFITQVRDPVARASSQYRFWNDRMKLKSSFDEYLRHPASRNLQVRKIAGCEDLNTAKEIISKHFMLVGTVEGFDAFLVLLANKLKLPMSQFTYRVRNIGKGTRPADLPDSFIDGLRARNELDQRLYEWVQESLFPRHVAEYDGDFEADLNLFGEFQARSISSNVGQKIDFVYRNAYLKPASGLLRLAHGLPFNGSYSTG